MRHEGGGTLQIEHISGADHNIVAKGGSQLVYNVPQGTFGLHYVIAEGGSPREVSCKFEQISFARDGTSETAPPLVPWNFYFWPSADPYLYPETTVENGVRTIRWIEMPNTKLPLEIAALRKYARAFGKHPDLAEQWERKFHVKSRGPRWMGHCHLAAAASILFDEPKAKKVDFIDLSTTKPASEQFGVEEIKYLVSEWVGQFGVRKKVWALEEGGKVFTRDPMLFYPMLFKPGEVKDLGALTFALRSYHPDWDDAPNIAKAVVAQTPDIFTKVETWLGKAAATFYQVLIDEMRVKKHALVCDLRSMNHDAGPAEVWNHAIFYYKASYREVIQPRNPADPKRDVNDPFDIWVTCEIYANEDILETDPATHELKSSGLPAIIAGNDVTPGGAGQLHRKSTQDWRIIFDQKGNINPGDPRNTWLGSKAGGSGRELYAPVFLLEVQSPVAEPNQGLALEVGNAQVGQELVREPHPLATVRRRFKGQP